MEVVEEVEEATEEVEGKEDNPKRGPKGQTPIREENRNFRRVNRG